MVKIDRGYLCEPKDFKKDFDVKGADPGIEERLENQSPEVRRNFRGINGDPLSEPLPSYIKAKCEKVINGENNTWIVLGRDRPNNRASGYINNTQAGAVDIVVGRGAPCPKKYNPPLKKKVKGTKTTRTEQKEKRVWVDPDFIFDAARIYISQKTDVDHNFNLASGSVGFSTAKSAVAIKADGVRIMAREGIKLVTHTDGINSQGGEVVSTSGIDLMSGNSGQELQPLVKGRYLIEALEKLVTHVDKLSGVVDAILMYQSAFNKAVTHHTHLAPFKTIPVPGGVIWETTPSIAVVAAGVKEAINQVSQSKRSLMMCKTNFGMYKFKYFNPAGDGYINSRYNNTT